MSPGRETDGGVARVTLARPDGANPTARLTAEELAAAFRRFDEDDSLAVAVLTGANDTFCAGADLSEFKHLTPANQGLVEQRADLTCRTQAMMQKLSKPVVSAVRGAAGGGGGGLGNRRGHEGAGVGL